MDRLSFASGIPREPILWYVMVSWQTWSDVCDLIPKHNFVHGVFLDVNGSPMQDANDVSDRMGVIVRGASGKEMLFREGDKLYLKAGKLYYYNDDTRNFEEP
jgi:hypothetical protein